METHFKSLYRYLDKQSTETLVYLIKEHLKSEDLKYYAPIVRDIIKIIRQRKPENPVTLPKDIQDELDRLFEDVLNMPPFEE